MAFLASSYPPFKSFSYKKKGLVGRTEEGHQLGLVFYAISYIGPALLFAPKTLVIPSGIWPMAYG